MTEGERRPDAAANWSGFRGIGLRIAERLAKLGIDRPQALLTHVPLRYEDRTQVTAMGALSPGMNVLVVGEVLVAERVRARRAMLVVRLGDGTGYVTLRFFHFHQRLLQSFGRGSRFACFGEVRTGQSGLEMVHPTVYRLDADAAPPVESRLTPVYPTVNGLSQASLRRAVEQAFSGLREGRLEAYDMAPQRAGWPSLMDAVEAIHHPRPEDGPPAPGHPALERLAFDELLAHFLLLRRLREQDRHGTAHVLSSGRTQARALKDSLPFTLTAGQIRVAGEIETDLDAKRPMRRLLQGDVGSGKTVIAALAAARAVGAGWQAAFMAPTALLAEQHMRTLDAWFKVIGIPVGLVSATVSIPDRQRWLERAAGGEPLVLVGTHALIAGEAPLPRLALAVVDEQHRFGVEQRLALAGGERGAVHQLVMSATPIPRTLAMTLYADLDVSVLDERPPGRVPVVTAVMSEARRDELIARIGRVVGEGRQVYWVCPLIEESEVLEAQAAEKTEAALTAALPAVRVALVHGRLKAAEKDAIMHRFVAGEIDLLVATTVIEVGVDVPNATLMVIENAERLGLAQLHQLRGRVGRGAEQSHCVLLYKPPLGARARERLAAVRNSDDGFVIAEADLKLRGPGELVGTHQAGFTRMRVADLARDRRLIARLPHAAERVLASVPEAEIERLIQFWLGEDVRYADA
ncbi:MAG: ATP-dependent DNA helicase RecG [Gammaproteobacteria bacterium]